MLFDNEHDVILVPQHANKRSLISDANKFNIKFDEKRIRVVADFLLMKNTQWTNQWF